MANIWATKSIVANECRCMAGNRSDIVECRVIESRIIGCDAMEGGVIQVDKSVTISLNSSR